MKMTPRVPALSFTEHQQAHIDRHQSYSDIHVQYCEHAIFTISILLK